MYSLVLASCLVVSADKAREEGKLKLFPSDEDESLYIGSTQPTYAIEEAEQREKRTVWLERVEEDGI